MTIKRPVVTEKTIQLAADKNQYTFEVNTRANKNVARAEVEAVFKVTVTQVRSLNRMGKEARFGNTRKTGRRNHRKVMVFTLKSGDKIDLFTQ